MNPPPPAMANDQALAAMRADNGQATHAWAEVLGRASGPRPATEALPSSFQEARAPRGLNGVGVGGRVLSRGGPQRTSGRACDWSSATRHAAEDPRRSLVAPRRRP
jgi:hypothetical protein